MKLARVVQKGPRPSFHADESHRKIEAIYKNSLEILTEILPKSGEQVLHLAWPGTPVLVPCFVLISALCV